MNWLPKKNLTANDKKDSITFTQWVSQLSVALPIALFCLLLVISTWMRMRESSETALLSMYSLSFARSVDEIRYQNSVSRKELSELESADALRLRAELLGLEELYQFPEPNSIEYTTVRIPENSLLFTDEVEEIQNQVPDKIEEVIFQWIKESVIGTSIQGEFNE